LLVDHGRNTLDLSAAQRIGARLGWASERITAMQQEMSAIFRIETYAVKDPWTCDNVRAVNQFTDVQVRSEELAPTYDPIQQLGKINSGGRLRADRARAEAARATAVLVQATGQSARSLHLFAQWIVYCHLARSHRRSRTAFPTPAHGSRLTGSCRWFTPRGRN
jgi:hypothetical protein